MLNKYSGGLMLFILSMMMTACSLSSETGDDVALTPDEIRALFENNTYVLISMKTGKELLVYSGTDECTMRYVDGTRLKTMQWYIKNNQHCCNNKGKEICGEIFPQSNGVYFKVDKGKHTHTLKDFREGNHL